MRHHVTAQAKMLLLDAAGNQTLIVRFFSGLLAIAPNPI